MQQVLNNYNSYNNLVNLLQAVSTAPDKFDWIRKYHNRVEYVYPPKAEVGPFKSSIKEIVEEKLAEAIKRQNQLTRQQKKREEIILNFIKPENRYLWIDLDIALFSEYFVIEKWMKYWLRLLDSVEAFKKTDTDRESFSDVVIDRARNYPLQDLIDTEIKGAGLNKLKTFCPFHPDKTPSFFIFTNDNSGHCFGCGQHVKNSIDYLLKKENISFREAVRRLN